MELCIKRDQGLKSYYEYRKNSTLLTEEQKQAIIDDKLATGDSNYAIAERHGVNESTVRKTIKCHIKPDFTTPPQKRVNPIKTLEFAAQRIKKHRTDKDYQKISIKTVKPIAIMKMSDIHFGGLDIDYEALLSNTKFLLENDNFYIQLFGDDINLMVTVVYHPDRFEHVCFPTPWEAYRYMTGRDWK